MSDASWAALRAYAEERGHDFDELVNAASSLLAHDLGDWEAATDADLRRMVADELAFDSDNLRRSTEEE